MIFLLDENLPQSIAKALDAVVSTRSSGHSVVHSRTFVGPGAADTRIFAALSSETTDRGVILTLDRYKVPLEQAALRGTELLVFSLHKAWSKHGLWPQFQGLVAFWPAIQLHAETAGPGYRVYEVPFGLNGRGRLRPMSNEATGSAKSGS